MARHNQPAMRNSPPIGVIVPSFVIPLNAMAYKDPLNSVIPIRKHTAEAVNQAGMKLPECNAASAQAMMASE